MNNQLKNYNFLPLLSIGLIGSTCIHAAVMIAPVPTLWKSASNEIDDTIEVIIDPNSEEKITEVAQEVKPSEPENNPITEIEPIQPIETAPMSIALAPETPQPQNEGKDAAAPDNLKPLLTPDASETKIQIGGGTVISKDGLGSGFGNAKIPTGFVLGGKINGNPNGSKNGIINGIINGIPNGKGTQTSATPLPAANPSNPPANSPAPKLECLSCPKPQYRGREGNPRVTYDIAPDGRVINVRLRQSSGDAQTDRETLEAISKWQFNPQTIPQGGRTNVKVRVTFEEDGSQFQRENEERRRRQQEAQAAQQAEERRLTESRQREMELPQPTSPATPANIPSPAPVTAPTEPPAPNSVDANTSNSSSPLPTTTTPSTPPEPLAPPANVPTSNPVDTPEKPPTSSPTSP